MLLLQESHHPWDSLTGYVCSIPPSGRSWNALCEPEISENHRKIRMEVLNLFPVLKELMNHTWSIFERYLSGLLLKISNDAGAMHSSSNLVAAILNTNVYRWAFLLIFKTMMSSPSCWEHAEQIISSLSAAALMVLMNAILSLPNVLFFILKNTD